MNGGRQPVVAQKTTECSTNTCVQSTSAASPQGSRGSPVSSEDVALVVSEMRDLATDLAEIENRIARLRQFGHLAQCAIGIRLVHARERFGPNSWPRYLAWSLQQTGYKKEGDVKRWLRIGHLLLAHRDYVAILVRCSRRTLDALCYLHARRDLRGFLDLHPELPTLSSEAVRRLVEGYCAHALPEDAAKPRPAKTTITVKYLHAHYTLPGKALHAADYEALAIAHNHLVDLALTIRTELERRQSVPPHAPSPCVASGGEDSLAPPDELAACRASAIRLQTICRSDAAAFQSLSDDTLAESNNDLAGVSVAIRQELVRRGAINPDK